MIRETFMSLRLKQNIIILPWAVSARWVRHGDEEAV